MKKAKPTTKKAVAKPKASSKNAVAHAAIMRFRRFLVNALKRHVKAQGWTSTQAAKAFRLTGPRYEAFRQKGADAFDVDRLLAMTIRAGCSYHLKSGKTLTFVLTVPSKATE